MKNGKIRRFRPRSNKHFSNRRPNGSHKNLAKEALGLGDKILHENYLQHSDHFSRILSEVNQRNISDSAPKSETNKPQE
jgi:hypothetical protein